MPTEWMRQNIIPKLMHSDIGTVQEQNIVEWTRVHETHQKGINVFFRGLLRFLVSALLMFFSENVFFGFHKTIFSALFFIIHSI